jgi:hypothetical protein
MRNRKLRIGILIGIIVILGLSAGVFLVWAYNPHQAMPEALSSIESNDLVGVEIDPWITFTPTEGQPITGFIFYPGGLVEAQAYAPALWALAESGYLTIITPMPLNLAVLDSCAAAEVIAAHPEFKNWAIGGHSLGGSMAVAFIDQNPDLIMVLVLWASYPTESHDLSDQQVKVSSLYGTLDGVATPEEVLAGKTRLPTDTTWVPIKGGNHAQFG